MVFCQRWNVFYFSVFNVHCHEALQAQLKNVQAAEAHHKAHESLKLFLKQHKTPVFLPSRHSGLSSVTSCASVVCKILEIAGHDVSASF